MNLTFYPKVGGVENSLRALCESFANSGYDVTVVTSDVVDGSGIKYSDNEHMFGAKIRRFTRKHFLSYFFSCYRLLKELDRSEKFNLVISRSHITTYLAYHAGFRNIKYVLPGIVKNQYDMRYLSTRNIVSFMKVKFNSYIQKKSLTMAQKNLVFSDTMYHQARSISPSAVIEKIYPGCDDKRFYSSSEEKVYLRARYGFHQNHKILLCVGRLFKVKGFEHAIKSLLSLPSDYVLVILGSGPEFGALVQICERLELKDRVFFYKDSNEPELFYRLSDGFLFTSLYEPFGQVLLEATFSKLKIFAFDPTVILEVDTATRQIFKGYESLICYVESLDSLDERIKNEFDIFVLDDGLVNSFIEKFSWGKTAESLSADVD
jgi:glycosyltransferase involved in cell wall biosynthesis